MTDLPDIQYVTALYDIYSRPLDKIIFDFTPFLKTNMNILVFTDQTELPSIIESNPNIHIHHLPKKELSTFQVESFETLPSNRNKDKDTLEFLQLMNAKPDFLNRALELRPAKSYCWFDMGILKISKNPQTFLEKMSHFGATVAANPKKVILPGCTSKELVQWAQSEHYFTTPIWRFCGGIILLDRTVVADFFLEHMLQFQKCIAAKTLTWEVNLFAMAEQEKPDMFLWYKADHDDTIVDTSCLVTHPAVATPTKPEDTKPEDQTRIIFLTMIKNESRIIQRCIKSVLPAVDAICVCDTGSTDNTVQVVNDYFQTLPIPAKIFNGPEHAWKNFGHNRSQSFLSAVAYCNELGWNPNHTYALVLDADMELVVPPGFSKQDLTENGYKIIQKSYSLEYYNTRLMKISFPWKCSGVTHEYWDGCDTVTWGKDKLYISDLGDGGCKADKFERDVRLLLDGLKESPNNPRYLFYLAQSYKDNGQLDESIEYYKKRIDAGGWYEEVWYSMYQLMKLYGDKKDYPQMEMWGLKAYEFNKNRSENLLHLCRHFKDKLQHHKAWQYYLMGSAVKKPNELLFIETSCYEKDFDFERTILHDYVYPERKKQSLEYSLEHYNRWGIECCYSNIQWFVQKIPAISVRRLGFQDIGDFVATSTSILAKNNGFYQLNVRYVNYRIQPNGSYLMMCDGNLSGDNPVRTDNYTCLMDSSLNIVSPLQKMQVDTASLRDVHIKGLEDVRIFAGADGSIKYLGTTMEFSHDGKIRQVMGDYNVGSARFENQIQLKPPHNTDCEKNWIPYKDGRIIYGWHPFQIGSLDQNGVLQIQSKQDTPLTLRHMRGSSTLVLDGEYYYGLTHCVMYTTPRKYYHMVVKIDARADRLVGYTDPFYFQNNAIEYSLGFLKRGDEFVAIVSQNDRDPVMITFGDKDLVWRNI
jgi:glycosyltransferase involved in cell wall biosynthesis